MRISDIGKHRTVTPPSWGELFAGLGDATPEVHSSNSRMRSDTVVNSAAGFQFQVPKPMINTAILNMTGVAVDDPNESNIQRPKIGSSAATGFSVNGNNYNNTNQREYTREDRQRGMALQAIGDDADADLVQQYKRICFHFKQSNSLYLLNIFYSTTRSFSHFMTSERSLHMRHGETEKLSGMVNTAGKNGMNIIEPGHRSIPKNDATRRKQMSHLIGSAQEMVEYVHKKCPEETRRGFYDYGSSALVHRLLYERPRVMHYTSGSSKPEKAFGSVGVMIHGQKGNSDNTRASYLDGYDHAFKKIVRDGEAGDAIYATSANVAIDWEALHGPFLKSSSLQPDKIVGNEMYKIHLASSFCVFMFYNFIRLLNSYYEKNKNTANPLPKGISLETYEILKEQSKEWENVQIYEKGDVIDNRPFRIMNILSPDDNTGNLWKVEGLELYFVVPYDWAVHCNESFHISNSTIQYLVPEEMALSAMYGTVFDDEQKDDVYFTAKLIAESFFPFAIYYALPDNSAE